jgi:hypothetical protein
VTEKYLPRPIVTITINLPVHLAAKLIRISEERDWPVSRVIGYALSRLGPPGDHAVDSLVEELLWGEGVSR